MLVLHPPHPGTLHNHVCTTSPAGTGLAIDPAGPPEAVPAHSVLSGQHDPLKIPDLIHLVLDRQERSLDRSRDLLQAPYEPSENQYVASLAIIDTTRSMSRSLLACSYPGMNAVSSAWRSGIPTSSIVTCGHLRSGSAGATQKLEYPRAYGFIKHSP